MEYLKSITIADINDRIRISCLINENGSFTMSCLTIYDNDYITKLFEADNDSWIKETLLSELSNKNYQNEEVIEFKKIIKQQEIKRKHVIKVIQEAIKMKML